MTNVAQYFDSFVTILTGPVICIPLVTQIVKLCKQLIINKQWPEIVALAADLMMQAERQFDNGGEKLDWVMGMQKASSVTAKYDMSDEDWYRIEKMIRSMCDMAKVVNTTIIVK